MLTFSFFPKNSTNWLALLDSQVSSDNALYSYNNLSLFCHRGDNFCRNPSPVIRNPHNIL